MKIKRAKGLFGYEGPFLIHVAAGHIVAIAHNSKTDRSVSVC